MNNPGLMQHMEAFVDIRNNPFNQFLLGEGLPLQTAVFIKGENFHRKAVQCAALIQTGNVRGINRQQGINDLLLNGKLPLIDFCHKLLRPIRAKIQIRFAG